MKSILFIDDDQFVTALYKAKLQSEGFVVDAANSGSEAIEKLNQSCPDAIVLDLNMPKINGIQVLRSIRSAPQLQHIPVIVFSSGYVRSMVDEASQLGIYKILTKAQCPPNKLILEIKELMSKIPEAPVPEETVEIPNIDLPSLLHLFGTSEDPSELHAVLLKIYQAVYPHLQTAIALDESMAQGKLGRMLEKLFEDLYANPEHITASTKQTLAVAIQKLDGVKNAAVKTELDSELALKNFLQSLEE